MQIVEIVCTQQVSDRCINNWGSE